MDGVLIARLPKAVTCENMLWVVGDLAFGPRAKDLDCSWGCSLSFQGRRSISSSAAMTAKPRECCLGKASAILQRSPIPRAICPPYTATIRW